ncbi:MAG: hypothetical protein LBQ01_08915 [Prevotellaceae bacterium]|nr:hypothetical protein [Prevotellaceae bacterium]
MACLTAYLPAGRAVRAKSIPLGMHRSVEQSIHPVLHHVRDASLTGCKTGRERVFYRARHP